MPETTPTLRMTVEPRTQPLTARLTGFGHALPVRVVENETIEQRLGVDAGWIENRTGIARRRWASEGETIAGLAAQAARRALESASVDAGEVDLVLVATVAPDRMLPNVAPQVAHALGANRAGALDVGAACSGWVSAIGLAAAQIESGRARTVLVIGAEVLSRRLNPDDRTTAGLFSDAAGATVVQAVEGGGGIGPVVMGCDGSKSHLVTTGGEDEKIVMRGLDTFREAVPRMCEITTAAAEAAGCTLDDIAYFVFHQANKRILDAVALELGLNPARVVESIREYGNSSAATVPLTLDLLHAERAIEPGALVLVGAFGAGLTWAGAVIEFPTSDPSQNITGTGLVVDAASGA